MSGSHVFQNLSDSIWTIYDPNTTRTECPHGFGAAVRCKDYQGPLRAESAIWTDQREGQLSALCFNSQYRKIGITADGCWQVNSNHHFLDTLPAARTVLSFGLRSHSQRSNSLKREFEVSPFRCTISPKDPQLVSTPDRIAGFATLSTVHTLVISSMLFGRVLPKFFCGSPPLMYAFAFVQAKK